MVMQYIGRSGTTNSDLPDGQGRLEQRRYPPVTGERSGSGCPAIREALWLSGSASSSVDTVAFAGRFAAQLIREAIDGLRAVDAVLRDAFGALDALDGRLGQRPVVAVNGGISSLAVVAVVLQARNCGAAVAGPEDAVKPAGAATRGWHA